MIRLLVDDIVGPPRWSRHLRVPRFLVPFVWVFHLLLWLDELDPLLCEDTAVALVELSEGGDIERKDLLCIGDSKRNHICGRSRATSPRRDPSAALFQAGG